MMSLRRQPGRGALLVGLGAYIGLKAWRWLSAEDLSGKVVLISGGSRGLGLAMATAFAEKGCDVAICGRDDKSLARAAETLAPFGTQVWTRKCDVADPDQVREMVAEATEVFGRIDILVNNAGIIQVGPLESMSFADFGRALATNFFGAVHLVDSLLPQMRERGGGHILNIVSIGGAVSVPHLLPYGAAKAALLNYSEGLTAELRKDGISVSTVIPGLMRTGSPVNALFKGDRAKELAWFSASDCLPMTSMSAARAARRIVAQSQSKGGEIVLSWPARLLRLVHALAPNTTLRVLGGVNRLLPAAPPPSPDEDRTARVAVRGMHVEEETPSSTKLAPGLASLAREHNQLAGHVHPSSSK